jgi:hypothetical protein
MEQPEVKDQVAITSPKGTDAPTAITSSAQHVASVLPAQGCPTCGAAPATIGGTAASPSYIYAIGKIEPRFPRPSVEKEFAQATGRADATGLTDRQAAQKVLSQRSNRYIVRQLCWVMTIEGLETYLLVPRDPADLDLLVEALRPTPSPTDLDCVIGVRGPIASPQTCNGLQVPIVAFDQLYSFDRDSLISAIPKPEGVTPEAFTATAGEVFDRIMQMADNAGATDEHRALNYLAVRYPAIYATATELHNRNSSLTAVDVQPSPLSGTRKVVEVVFSFTNRSTDVAEQYFTRVDVTEEFPFLVTKMSPYYSR